jgi:hypothetical protein
MTFAKRALILASLTFTLLPICSQQRGQAQTPDRAPRPPASIEELRKLDGKQLAAIYLVNPPYNPTVIHQLIYLHDPSTLVPLKRAFQRDPSSPESKFLAAAIISLGDSDITAYTYLSKLGREVVESGLPFFARISDDGTITADPEFNEWVVSHQVDAGKAHNLARYEHFATMMAIAEAGDKRFESILLQGLGSHNYMVVLNSALGLARLHDDAYVIPIVKACSGVTAPVAEIIAQSLFYFNTAAAKEAIAKFVRTKEMREAFNETAIARTWQHAAGERLQ